MARSRCAGQHPARWCQGGDLDRLTIEHPKQAVCDCELRDRVASWRPTDVSPEVVSIGDVESLGMLLDEPR